MNYPKQPPFLILVSSTKPRVAGRMTARRPREPISSLPPIRAAQRDPFLSSSGGLSSPAETAASPPQTHLAQPSHGDGRTCNWINPLRVAFNQNSSNGWGNGDSVSLKNHLWRFFSIVKTLKGKREVNSVNPWNKGQDGHHSPLYAYSLWSFLRC